jgi:hypothetical protein
MLRHIVLASALALTGCNFTAQNEQVAVDNMNTAIARFNQAVAAGQLFCKKTVPTGIVIVGLAEAAVTSDNTSAPILAINQTAAYVKAACAAVGGVPTVPPVSPVQTVAIIPPAK